MLRVAPSAQTASLLLRWRQSLGWTQKMMARMLGVGQTTLSRWERGKGKLPIILLENGEFVGVTKPTDYGPDPYDLGEDD